MMKMHKVMLLSMTTIVQGVMGMKLTMKIIMLTRVTKVVAVADAKLLMMTRLIKMSVTYESGRINERF